MENQSLADQAYVKIVEAEWLAAMAADLKPVPGAPYIFMAGLYDQAQKSAKEAVRLCRQACLTLPPSELDALIHRVNRQLDEDWDEEDEEENEEGTVIGGGVWETYTLAEWMDEAVVDGL